MWAELAGAVPQSDHHSIEYVDHSWQSHFATNLDTDGILSVYAGDRQDVLRFGGEIEYVTLTTARPACQTLGEPNQSLLSLLLLHWVPRFDTSVESSCDCVHNDRASYCSFVTTPICPMR